MPKVTEDLKEKKEINKKTTSKTTSNNKNKATKKTSNNVKSSESKDKASVKSSRTKTTSKKSSGANNSGKSKKTTKSTIKTIKEKKSSTFLAEYYDLPYRYNQTIVRILAQTPKMLFVYWDISDEDRQNLEVKYGSNFFSTTKPVLVIHNINKNYSFEVDINDFANSWYLHINDPDDKYTVELGRRPIYKDNNFYTDYIYISSSNMIETPNDHILIERLKSPVTFKNVKSNFVYSRDIGSLSLISINNLYKKMYKDDILSEFNNPIIKNTSSSSFFK